jgi:alkylation response protein AidB-like acyl-CoA dehydrogenase
MRFALTDEQRGFARSLDDLLSEAGVTQLVREWSGGEHSGGIRLWQQLADLGVTGLLVSEADGGLDAEPVDLVVAFEAIGRHAVPGPWVESVAFLPTLFRGAHDVKESGDWLAALAAGDLLATVAAPPQVPFGLDADAASIRLVLIGGELALGQPGQLQCSVDRARRLFPLAAGEPAGSVDQSAVSAAFDMATLACSAQLLGAGERLLAQAVAYARSRRQFGRPIGEFQALKHAMAGVRVALDFTRPLLYRAALSVGADTAQASRDVSAAKVAASDSAYQAARTSLQVHGAIGYTAECDLGLWLTKVRALVGAWGTPSVHRARVLDAITAS